MQRVFHAWLLWSVLVAQAVLTLPWLWRTAPFTDEALYLRAGHQEWSHWLHHAALPNYAAWFSGAPDFYPPLGAAADSLGGLAAARGLSLILMLGSTSLVYLAALRLFGRLDAFFASVLFAVCGLVVHNGAFATYNPLALFFLVLGLWAAIRARSEGYKWIALCAVALLLSNFAKYATLAWDPVVIGIAVLHSWGDGAAEALRRGLSLSATVAVLDVGCLMLGGADYVTGVKVTTVFRTIHFGSSEPPSVILWRAFAVTGPLVVPAVLGVIVSAARRDHWQVTTLLALLVLGALIAPVDQAHLRQLGSLDKNMGFGLPFAAIAAGYVVSAVIGWAEQWSSRGRIAAGSAGAALIALVLIAGRLQSVQFRGPSSAVAAQLVSAVSKGYQPGTYILSDGAARMEQYYLPRIPSITWIGVFNPSLALRTRIQGDLCAGRVSLVILKSDHGSYDHPYDYQIRNLIGHIRRYRLAVAAGQGYYKTQVWQLTSHNDGGFCQR
jgi:4-amino-4-deoxy-L-arabinose transferase-like glycosyltransferase